VENTTAANRAVNIPEFVNIRPDDLQQIDPQAAEVYRVADRGFELMGNGQVAEAIPEWRKALQMDPDDANWHFNLAVSLWKSNQEPEAVAEFDKTCDLDPNESKWFGHLAAELSQTGDLDEATVKLDIACYRKSLSLDPSDAKVQAALGVALFRDGQAQEGYEHLQRAVEMDPGFADGHNELATALAKMGRVEDAVVEVQKAIALSPSSAEYRYNLGFALELRGDLAGAIEAFQKSVELSQGKDIRCLAALAEAYDKAGRSAEAIRSARQAVDLAVQEHDQQREQDLRFALERYQSDSAKTQP
jgi:superkiller protein 3